MYETSLCSVLACLTFHYQACNNSFHCALLGIQTSADCSPLHYTYGLCSGSRELGHHGTFGVQLDLLPSQVVATCLPTLISRKCHNGSGSTLDHHAFRRANSCSSIATAQPRTWYRSSALPRTLVGYTPLTFRLVPRLLPVSGFWQCRPAMRCVLDRLCFSLQ